MGNQVFLYTHFSDLKNMKVLFFISLLFLIIMSQQCYSEELVLSRGSVFDDDIQMQKDIMSMPYGIHKFPESLIKELSSSDSPSIISAFKASPELRSSDLQLTYYVTDNNTIEIDLRVYNNLIVDIQHEILVFIDYHLVPFWIANDEVNNYQLSTTAGGQTDITIGINRFVSDGSHDLLILGMERRMNTGRASFSGYDIYHRANLLVNTTSYNEKHEAEVIIDPLQVKQSFAYFLPNINEASTSQAVVANPNDYSLSYAVLFLGEINTSVDLESKRQVSTLLPMEQLVLGENERETFTLPEKPLERTWVIVVEQPFIELESPRGTMTKKPSGVYISLKPET